MIFSCCCTIFTLIIYISVLIKISSTFIVILVVHHERIWINEIVTSVIRRVNVNHLDCTKITFLQKFQHFQIVALDVKVLGSIPIHAFFLTRTQRFTDRLVGFHDSSLFTYPCKFVCFAALNHITRKHLLEQFKVDGFLSLAVFVNGLGDTVREQRPNLFYVLSR